MIRYFEFAAKTKVLILTFIGTLLFALVIFPNLPIGGESLDARLHYDIALVHELMAQYGEDGRRIYSMASPTLDTLFPLIYMTFFVGLIYRLRANDLFGWLAIIPVITGFVDLGENIQITTILLQYPDISAGQVQSASLFTQTKTILVFVTGFLAIGFVLLATGKFVLSKFRNS